MIDLPTDQIVAFIREHHVYAGVVVGLLCFAESIAVLSFFVPATALLVAAGGLVGTGIVPFHELVIGGVIGCLLGDGVSYAMGRWFGPHTSRIWPFKNNPALLEQGNAFFAKHGWWGVFIGRFFGPLRAVVPLSAGIMRMNQVVFWLVSSTSAMVFVPVALIPGTLLGLGAGGAASGDLMAVLPALVMLGTPLLIAFVWLYSIRHRFQPTPPPPPPGGRSDAAE